MNNPEISVVVPAYNVEPYLRQCVDSVLQQTFTDFELILIDDGSTDATPAICDAYAADDPRVRVVHQENAGVSQARNGGLGMARGRFVTYMDGDDWLDPDTFKVAHRQASEHLVDVVLWPYVREYSDLSLPKPLFAFDERVFDQQEIRLMLCRRMVGPLGEELRTPENSDVLVTAWGKLYSRELLTRSGAAFVDTNLVGTSEDALYNLQVFTHAQSAVYINRFLHHYRRDNVSSLTTLFKPNLASQWDTLHELMRRHIADHSLGPSFEQALRNRVALSILGLGLNGLNSDSSARSEVQQLRAWLSTDVYREAISSLEFRWLPSHWKLFYTAAKWRCAGLLWLLLRTISRLRDWRNRAESR